MRRPPRPSEGELPRLAFEAAPGWTPEPFAAAVAAEGEGTNGPVASHPRHYPALQRHCTAPGEGYLAIVLVEGSLRELFFAVCFVCRHKLPADIESGWALAQLPTGNSCRPLRAKCRLVMNQLLGAKHFSVEAKQGERTPS